MTDGWTSPSSAEPLHSPQSSLLRVTCGRSIGNGFWASSSRWKTTASPVKFLGWKPTALQRCCTIRQSCICSPMSRFRAKHCGKDSVSRSTSPRSPTSRRSRSSRSPVSARNWSSVCLNWRFRKFMTALWRSSPSPVKPAPAPRWLSGPRTKTWMLSVPASVRSVPVFLQLWLN